MFAGLLQNNVNLDYVTDPWSIAMEVSKETRSMVPEEWPYTIVRMNYVRLPRI